MTSFTVQFVMPVDNPVNKVSMKRQKHHFTFEVPLNHPDAHKMSLMDLIAAAELSGLLTVSPDLNNKRKLDKGTVSKATSPQSSH